MDNIDISAFRHLVTPRVRDLSGRELATTAIRRELVAAGNPRSTDQLAVLLPLSRSLALTMAEVQRLSGFARQTLYSALEGEPASDFRDEDTERLARLMTIAIVAAGQEQSLETIGGACHVDSAALVAPARLLEREGRVTLAPSRSPGKAAIAPTPLAAEWLRIHVSSRELDDRAPGFTVYLEVEAAVAHRIDEVAREIVGLDEAAVLPYSTAPSLMRGPELAITIRASDQRSALQAAQAIWDETCRRLGSSAPMRIADLHPPLTGANAPSAVLDAFVDAICVDLDEELKSRVRGKRERFDGGEPERTLAGRCLTVASRGFWRFVGEDEGGNGREISNGDAAFDEFVALNASTSASAEADRAREPLIEALRLAGERLGPFRGGELASFKAPGGTPKIVAEVAPSKEDLAQMARLSAASLKASASFSPIEAVRFVMGDGE